MHTDLGITIQQYSFAAIFWLAYSALGTASLYILILLLNFLIRIPPYKICMLNRNKNASMSLFLMLVTDTILILGFITTRPQIVSSVLFLTVIYTLELYTKTI